jgi:Tol biopolymer transport system component
MPTRLPIALLTLLILTLMCPARAQELEATLAFPRDGSIIILDLATGKERELVKGLVHDRPVEWSPDGQHLLYSKHGDIGWDLWIIDADGKNPRNLTNVNSGGARSGVWSPDGTRIAYMRDNPQGLYIINRDGANPTRLSHDGFRDQPPAWSPDGKWLVYQEFGFVDESARAESKFKIELHAVAADGSKKQKLAPAEGSSDGASYSPKGDKLLYRGTRGQSGEICTIELASGKEIALTRSPAEDYAPNWSRDGTKIAFWRDSEEGPELWIMQSDGGDPKKLASAKPQTRVDRPQWSEGANLIAYGGADPNDGVWVLHATQQGTLKRIAQGAGAHARWRPPPAK